MKVFEVAEFDIPLYGGKVTFILFSNTWDKVIKYLKGKGFKTKGYKDWGYIQGMQHSENIDGSQRFVVIIKKNENMKDTLVHELFHLTQDILEYRGVNFIKGDANEAYAYLIGTLFAKTEKLLK